MGSSEIPKADDSDSAELTELLRCVFRLPFPSGFMFNTDLRKSLLGKIIPDCGAFIFEHVGGEAVIFRNSLAMVSHMIW